MAAAIIVSVNVRVDMCLHFVMVLLWMARAELILWVSIVQCHSTYTFRHEGYPAKYFTTPIRRTA